MPIIDVPSPQRDGSPDLCSAWCEIGDLTLDDEQLAAIDPVVLDDALMVASEWLYNLTLQQWPGECGDTVRPCADFGSPDTIRTYPTARIVAGSWDSGVWAAGAFTFCSCGGNVTPGGRFGCWHVSQIELGEVPVISIVSVTIDGDEVPAERYRIDDYRWLVFQPDPTGEYERTGWPCCQNMSAPAGDDGTFVVSYTVGSLPGRAGVRAAASLAGELALMWTPSVRGKCRLGSKVQSLSRQQVSVRVNDPQSLLDKGLVGLEDVDGWVQSVLRAQRTRHAAVVIPERRRQQVRRTTG